jgi:cold shock CspA family protein
MVTKAIITEIVDKYQAKVRIPIFNKAQGSAFATPDNELAVAPICAMAGSAPNYKPGDVVFVAFEYDTFSYPVILGSLLTESSIQGNTSDFNVNRLHVVSEAELPDSTTVNGFIITGDGAGDVQISSETKYDFIPEDNVLHITSTED